MRRILLALLFLFFSSIATPSVFAANPTSQTSSSATQEPARKAALARNQELIDFYKKDSAFRKESFQKRLNLLKQINELHTKSTLSKDANEKKNLGVQVDALNKQLNALNEETAKQELVLAEFSLKQSQERLERAKKRLAEVQKKALAS